MEEGGNANWSRLRSVGPAKAKMLTSDTGERLSHGWAPWASRTSSTATIGTEVPNACVAVSSVRRSGLTTTSWIGMRCMRIWSPRALACSFPTWSSLREHREGREGGPEDSAMIRRDRLNTKKPAVGGIGQAIH